MSIDLFELNWERHQRAKELLSLIDNFQHAQSGGDVEAVAENLARALDHYIARSSQGWAR